uniref:Uncharacterized protein n=1 Tax=Psilocybe cubensis TaxID=181762 RepID=A0A8H7XUC8_PSICU
MSSERQNTQFSQKERQEIDTLKHTMQDPGSSRLEQQIAEAKLDALKQSKEPAPHMHKHRVHGAEGEGTDGSNIYHNDEAFERFAMGERDSAPTGPRANQPAADRHSIKMNHKVRGTTKEKAENNLPTEELHGKFMG